MKVDENGNTILEVGDTILDVRNRVGIIQSINSGHEDDFDFWEAMIYYTNENESYTTYRCEIQYVLTPVKFS